MMWWIIGGLLSLGIVANAFLPDAGPKKAKRRQGSSSKSLAHHQPKKTPKAKAYAWYMNDIHGEGMSREAFDTLLKPFREQVADFKKRTRRIKKRLEKIHDNKPIAPEIHTEAKMVLAEIRECDGKLDAFERSIYCETDGGHEKIIQIMESLHEVEADLDDCIFEIENFEPDS